MMLPGPMAFTLMPCGAREMAMQLHCNWQPLAHVLKSCQDCLASAEMLCGNYTQEDNALQAKPHSNRHLPGFSNFIAAKQHSSGNRHGMSAVTVFKLDLWQLYQWT